MSEEPIPDGLLLRRYRERRDEEAFTELHRRHGRLVLATCRRETGDSALAEEAAQGVFLLLIRKVFDDDASLAGWLHGASRLVSRNLMREEGRRRRRERRAYEEYREPDSAWNAVAPHVDEALAALGAKDLEAILLRFASDQSLSEVGEALGIGENAARMRVSRALERMRTHLQRVGVGVGVLLLASMLSTRLADAELTPLAPPSERTRRIVGIGHGSMSTSLALGSVALIVLGGLVFRAMSGEKRLSTAEATRIFRSSEGGWRGTLEFADDATGVRTSTPTTVDVQFRAGGLRLAARYPHFANLDVTTIDLQPDGPYPILTGGPGSSHRLDGAYDFVRQPNGTPAFVGYSPAARGEIRLSLQADSGSLTLQEEIRRTESFRLRNRFELIRTP